MWNIVKWILIICLGPEILALVLRLAAGGAVMLAAWLDRWPLSPL